MNLIEQKFRRSLLKASVGFSTTWLLPPLVAHADFSSSFSIEIQEQRNSLLTSYRKTIEEFLSRSRLPIIDVEHHWGAKFPIEQLIEKMDRNDVALTWLGVNERNGSHSSAETCKQFSTRLIPTTIHGAGKRWHGRDLQLMQELASDVRSGKFFAMGEFEGRHYISNTNNRDIHTPINSPTFEDVFKLSDATGVPFLVHHEAEDALLTELEDMLSKYTKAKVIWCHVGRNRNPLTWTIFPTPEGVERFILKYPNLHFDMLQSGAKSIFPPTGAYESVLYTVDEKLEPEWKNLFNKYPDRFVIGTDINTGRWDSYDKVIRRLRKSVLEVLTPQAAGMIAYGNALKLMTDT